MNLKHNCFPGNFEWTNIDMDTRKQAYFVMKDEST